MIEFLMVLTGILIGCLIGYSGIVIFGIFDKKNRDSHIEKAINEYQVSDVADDFKEEELTESEIQEYKEEDEKAKLLYNTDLDNEHSMRALIENSVSNDGGIAFDKEGDERLVVAEKLRAEYVRNKRNGLEVEVPPLVFTISRQDIIDHLLHLKNQLILNGATFFPQVLSNDGLPDILYTGKWCFASLHEKENVVKVRMKLSDNEYDRIHPSFHRVSGDWYDFVVDSSFITKEEVYEIIDASYKYVVEAYCNNPAIVPTKEDIIDNEIFDLQFDDLINEYHESLQKYRQANKLSFVMTRKRLLHYVNTHKVSKEEVVEREKRYLPSSLKYDNWTYALVYEKNDKTTNASYVSLIVRISDDYAKWLSRWHACVRRANFPRNSNWYVVPIDSSFHSADMVYRLLNHAKNFVKRF